MHDTPKPPKLLKWPRALDQHYTQDQKILVTAGCSFTANTVRLDGPYSWPGVVLDRCGFEHCVDLSYPGVGNEFIANSVLNYVEGLDPALFKDVMIVVCWSGPDRKEELLTDANKLSKISPQIDNITYQWFRDSPSNQTRYPRYPGEVWRSWKNIIFLQNYLENKKIKFGFSLYCNTVDPPFLPRRDLTENFIDHLSKEKMTALKNCTWLHQFKDSFFEYCFFNNDCLSEDLFHPNTRGSLLWSDQVLLPGILAKNLITKSNA